MITSPQDIIHFWFNELIPADWWKKSGELDALICERFRETHTTAIQGKLAHWHDTHEGRLAEIIVLDQFSRNIFRDTPQAFEYDPFALKLSQEAVALDIHIKLPSSQAAFLLMPYMHSESPEVHETALELFSLPGLESSLDFEKKHKAIIDRFGRYPHRNKILGRESTPEEITFLNGPDSGF